LRRRLEEKKRIEHENRLTLHPSNGQLAKKNLMKANESEQKQSQDFQAGAVNFTPTRQLTSSESTNPSEVDILT